MDMLIKGKTSLSSLVGMGSRRRVDGFDELIVEISSARSMAKKWFKYGSF